MHIYLIKWKSSFIIPFSNSTLFSINTIVNNLVVLFHMFLGKHLYTYVCRDTPTYIHTYSYTHTIFETWVKFYYKYCFIPIYLSTSVQESAIFLTHSCWNLDIINIVNIINLMGGNISLFNLHFPAFSKIEQILTYSVATDILFSVNSH